MNANELADDLDRMYELSNIGEFEIAATTLRQQQEKLTKYELRNEEQRNRIADLEAEIEVLQKECDYWNKIAIERGKAQEK